MCVWGAIGPCDERAGGPRLYSSLHSVMIGKRAGTGGRTGVLTLQFWSLRAATSAFELAHLCVLRSSGECGE